MEPFTIISWTVVIAFIVILIITVLGMVGVIKFKYKNHLNKLFIVLIIEVVSLGFLIYKDGKEAHSVYLREAQEKYDYSVQLRKAQKFDESLKVLSEILRIEDDDTKFNIKNIFLQRGDILFERKLFSDAVVPYAIYNEIVQDDPQALSRYGRALRAVHRYDDARVMYERALALAPNDYFILNGLQNCIRRQAGFLMDAERKGVSDKYFQEARGHIMSMLTIAKTASENKIKKKLGAELALARLNWQWERYPEAIALFEEITSSNPSHSIAFEDLAAIYLEYSQYGGGNELVSKSLVIYKNAYENPLEDQDKIFIGAGIAEATSLLKEPKKIEVEFAVNAVSLSIAKNKTLLDDPYPFYAAALLYKKSGNLHRALKYLDEAIRAENKRADNLYIFDYKSLIKYERLKTKWEINANKS
ncbi:MAG: tetratricopeptide repeat protein [Thalassotalea sp.]